MILDKTENLLFYDKMVPSLKNGVTKLNQISQNEEGRYEFDGGYLMIQKGETKPLSEGTFEAHKKYIDVQIVLEGCEEISWANIKDLETVIEYDNIKDVERLDGERKHNVFVEDGMFYIMFPSDCHKPISHTNQQYKYTKCVMKLLI